MEKPNTTEKIPTEVQMVWAIQHSGQFVGMGLYRNLCEIIEKYPQYFTWEHTYAKIPQSVHDAYQKECRQETETVESRIPIGIGLMEQIRLCTTETNPINTEDISSMFVAYEGKKNKLIGKKQIWDKHYKEYGIEYRE